MLILIIGLNQKQHSNNGISQNKIPSATLISSLWTVILIVSDILVVAIKH